jgi:hypothetical protein
MKPLNELTNTELDLLELQTYRTREQMQAQLQQIVQNLMAISQEQAKRSQLVQQKSKEIEQK